MTDVHVLDLVKGDKVLLAYKRGIYTREQVKKKLLDECGLGTEEFADMAIAETDAMPLEKFERYMRETYGE
jgi:hypothetical protein